MSKPEVRLYKGQLAPWQPKMLVTYGARNNLQNNCAEEQARSVANQSILKSMEQSK